MVAVGANATSAGVHGTEVTGVTRPATQLSNMPTISAVRLSFSPSPWAFAARASMCSLTPGCGCGQPTTRGQHVVSSHMNTIDLAPEREQLTHAGNWSSGEFTEVVLRSANGVCSVGVVANRAFAFTMTACAPAPSGQRFQRTPRALRRVGRAARGGGVTRLHRTRSAHLPDSRAARSPQTRRAGAREFEPRRGRVARGGWGVNE